MGGFGDWMVDWGGEGGVGCFCDRCCCCRVVVRLVWCLTRKVEGGWSWILVAMCVAGDFEMILLLGFGLAGVLMGGGGASGVARCRGRCGDGYRHWWDNEEA